MQAAIAESGFESEVVGEVWGFALVKGVVFGHRWRVSWGLWRPATDGSSMGKEDGFDG